MKDRVGIVGLGAAVGLISAAASSVSLRQPDPERDRLRDLRRRTIEQAGRFRTWAENGEWGRFHSEHYDWWAFPLDEPSGAYGDRFVVEPEVVRALQADPDFMKALRVNLVLVCLSWGWDLKKRRFIKRPAPEQRWQQWPVRLYKMTLCAQLFGMERTCGSLRTLGNRLLAQGERFEYGGHDLSGIFTGKP